MKKEKLLDYIKKANKIHNNKYDYSKMNPLTCKDKSIVVCPEHGEFYTTFDGHVHGKNGCPKCVGRNKTQEGFILKATEIHNGYYDYSKVEYINTKTKICIICPEHGEFWQEPRHHQNGVGCPQCCSNRKLTTESFIKKANEVHKNKYIYSNTEYINRNNKVCIICPEHGEFWQDASSHLIGCGCPKCNGGVVLTTSEWIDKAIEIHNGYYDYSKVEYINAKTKVCIICPKHGEFWQEPSSHLSGKCCPKCKSSKLENIIISTLNKNKISYIYQFKIKELGKKSLDFYLPDYNIVIECQGEQHFVPVDFSRKNNIEMANDTFEKRKKLDQEKYDICNNNNLNIIYFTIPSYFREKDININVEFYKDKTIFTHINNMVDYLNNIDINNSNTNVDNYYHFYNDILSINSNIISENNIIKYKNYAIKYNKLDSNERDELNSVRRFYKKQNIKTLHIFEDEYLLHKDIVINKISHILEAQKDLPKISGRKCIVKEILKHDAEIFLNTFHIQGFVSSTIYLGAFYNDELIAVMTFLNENNGYWNLTRFASNYNYICQGIGGKLFKYFIRNYEFIEIKSFADRRWTLDENENIYTKLDFEFNKYTLPDYRYYNLSVSKYERFHKFGFRKEKLNRKYGLPLTMTENEMTKELGYIKIWDCGLIKYIYKNKNLS